MNLYYRNDMVALHHGDCLDVLRTLPDESIHAVITDPPYGLANTDSAHVVETLSRWFAGDRDYLPSGKGFMGKAWDAFVPPPAVWDECYRVLKPGGHLLCFAGTRTVDLMGLSIRLAGFDLRDTITWLYGSGFPKSLDVGKAIDGLMMTGKSNSAAWKHANENRPGEAWTRARTNNHTGTWVTAPEDTGPSVKRDTPATPEAQQWHGWGTALKPASEPIVVARKPLAGTVAANVLAHGTGALNIDACRVATDDVITNHARSSLAAVSKGIFGDSAPQETHQTPGQVAGRWPANVVMDGDAADALDEQSGERPSTGRPGSPAKPGTGTSGGFGGAIGLNTQGPLYDDTGGASRFYPVFRYQAKAPARERPAVDGVAHPTVKPLELMRWLVKLVTPEGGTVLEPFAGSGTTVEAALLEGASVVAVEREADYLPLIRQRVDRVRAGVTPSDGAAGEAEGGVGGTPVSAPVTPVAPPAVDGTLW